MSFGWSATDIANLAKLAWTTIQNCRKACGEYSELVRQVRSLHGVLKRCKIEFSKPEGLLKRPEDSTWEELRPCLDGSQDVLRSLNGIVSRYAAINRRDRGFGRFWTRVKFGNKELGTLNDLRQKTRFYTQAISTILATVTVGSLGRIENSLDEAGLKDIKPAIENLARNLAIANGKDYSVLTAYSNDDTAVWKELRRQLVKENLVPSQIIAKHKGLITSFFRELGERGAFDEPELESEAPQNDAEVVDEPLHAPGDSGSSREASCSQPSCQSLEMESRTGSCSPVHGLDVMGHDLDVAQRDSPGILVKAEKLRPLYPPLPRRHPNPNIQDSDEVRGLSPQDGGHCSNSIATGIIPYSPTGAEPSLALDCSTAAQYDSASAIQYEESISECTRIASPGSLSSDDSPASHLTGLTVQSLLLHDLGDRVPELLANMPLTGSREPVEYAAFRHAANAFWKRGCEKDTEEHGVYIIFLSTPWGICLMAGSMNLTRRIELFKFLTSLLEDNILRARSVMDGEVGAVHHGESRPDLQVVAHELQEFQDACHHIIGEVVSVCRDDGFQLTDLGPCPNQPAVITFCDEALQRTYDHWDHVRRRADWRKALNEWNCCVNFLEMKTRIWMDTLFNQHGEHLRLILAIHERPRSQREPDEGIQKQPTSIARKPPHFSRALSITDAINATASHSAFGPHQQLISIMDRLKKIRTDPALRSPESLPHEPKALAGCQQRQCAELSERIKQHEMSELGSLMVYDAATYRNQVRIGIEGAENIMMYLDRRYSELLWQDE